jgi:uncharacterized membrane protein YgcG
MNFDRGEDPFLALGSKLARWLIRHPYFLWSVLVHMALLTLAYYFGSYHLALTHQAQQAQQMSQTAQLASQTRTAKRVDDMQKILALLEQSRAEHVANDSQQSSEDEPEFSATSLPKKPEDLLADARALSKSIDEVAKDLKAEELAKVLKISKQEARAQIEAASKPEPAEASATAPMASTVASASTAASAAASNAASAAASTAASAAASNAASAAASSAASATTVAAPVNLAQVAATIKGLEDKARDTLAQRQKALDRQAQGINVTSAIASSTDSGRGDGAIRDRIDDFMNRDSAQSNGINGSGPGNQRSGGGFRLNGGVIGGRNIGSVSRIVSIPSSHSKVGLGRLVGAGGVYAERLYVDSWYIIGPFDGKQQFDRNHPNYSYAPEKTVLLDGVYLGKDKRLLKWQYVSDASYPLIPPDFAEFAVYYGYTELMMEEAVDMTMAVGADDDARVWVNDKVVWEGGEVKHNSFYNQVYGAGGTYQREFNMAEGLRAVHFKKGRNKILFKLSNGPLGTFFSMVLSK